MINYDNVCKRLDELMLELLQKGINIPQHLFDDLKSARSLISIYRTEPSELDLAMESSPLLKIVEMNLLGLAETELGKDYAEEWQKKIIDTYSEQNDSYVKTATFVAGIPKNEYWIRLNTSEIIFDKELSESLMQLNLTTKLQADGYLLIHGRKEDVKTFLKEVRQKVGGAELK